jgi:hypothetical protein
MKEYYGKIKPNIYLLKSVLAKYFEVDKSFIKISVSDLPENSYSAVIELNFEKPENSLRKFLLDSYSFRISDIEEESFKFEKKVYRFDDLKLFLEIISSQINSF